MTIKLPKTGTTTRKLLEFISQSKTGLRFSEMQKFLVEQSGRDWEKREVIPLFRKNIDGRWIAAGAKTVRVYRGWWCTNLLSGSESVCRKYLRKVDGRWMLNDATMALFFNLKTSLPVSSLDDVVFNDSLGTDGPVPASKVTKMYVDKNDASQSTDELISKLREAQRAVTLCGAAKRAAEADLVKALAHLKSIEEKVRLELGL